MGIMDNRPVLHVDANGNAWEGGESFHINATGTTQKVDSSPTYMHIINVNKAGDATALLTIYDSKDAVGCVASAVVATLDCSAVRSQEYRCKLSNGLFYTLAGSTVPDITITYSSVTTG